MNTIDVHFIRFVIVKDPKYTVCINLNIFIMFLIVRPGKKSTKQEGN